MIDSKFVQRLNERYRVLLEAPEGEGAWLISYESPSAPFFVAEIPDRCEAPESFCFSNQKVSKACREKLDALKPMLLDDSCITDKIHRRQMAEKISIQVGTTRKTVLQRYYRVLATGSLAKQKAVQSRTKDNPIFNWAIYTYYHSAHRYSLKSVYELMLLSQYTDEQGNLLDSHPTWGAFRHYFYDNDFHKAPSVEIARKGLGNYARNIRPAFGSAKEWKPYIGAYQVDAQEADVHLVSSLDHITPTGKGNLYMSVDTASEMIVGIHVTMSAGEEEVMRLIANSAANKVDFCRKYGVEISEQDWPCAGMPSEVISDKGSDFCSKRIEELCHRYSVQLESVPPYRSELKPLIERSFGILQIQYLDLLRGRGVTEDDASERWATDYRNEAVLTLQEFTRILILAILQTNRRVLPCGKTPLQLWNEKQDTARLLPVNDEDLYLMSLPRFKAAVRLTRKGIRFNNLDYAPVSMENLYLGDKYQVVWDPEDISTIYLVVNHEYVPCKLTKDSKKYIGLNFTEVKAAKANERLECKVLREQELSEKVNTLRQIRQIISEAEKECGR